MAKSFSNWIKKHSSTHLKNSTNLHQDKHKDFIQKNEWKSSTKIKPLKAPREKDSSYTEEINTINCWPIIWINGCVLFAQSCPTLCDPMDCSPPGFCVHEIFQARILEWVTENGVVFSRCWEKKPSTKTSMSSKTILHRWRQNKDVPR